jgi:hypothetical protein
MSQACITLRDILQKMVDGICYDSIMQLGKNPSEKGYIYESVCKLLIICNMLEIKGIVQTGNFSANTLSVLTNIKEIIFDNIRSGGDKSDITLIDGTNIIPISVKYRDNIKPDNTDIQKLIDISKKIYFDKLFKPGLIVKSKSDIINHHYQTGSERVKELHDSVIENKMLFDEDDIKLAFNKFQQLFNNKSMDESIDIINTDFLKYHKKMLNIRLHQQLTMLSITRKIRNENKKRFIIAHKCRSGKSITAFITIAELIKTGNINRCLFITSVPNTIDEFITTIHKYHDFNILNDSKRIYKEDIELKMNENFKGIIFVGMQFLKLDKTNTKGDWLSQYNPDLIVIDESQHGGSTAKTNRKIIKKIISSKLISNKIIIHISATPNKTKQFYGISDIYNWTFNDETSMQNIDDPIVRESMIDRHGPIFDECMQNHNLNKDYSFCPIPIHNRPELPKALENDIIKYNEETGMSLGFSWKSIFALEQTKKTNKKLSKYSDKFQLENSTSGIKLLKGILNWLISNNPNENSVMREIQECQSKYISRISTADNPLVHIGFLPKVGAIDILQKTIIRFLNEHNLWCDYRVVYSNANSNFGNMDLNLTDYINKQLEITKNESKDGLIVLLGDQGSLAITFEKCDVVFMFDDSTNMDYYLQRIMRCMTEAHGKRVGCIVDFNFQRTLLFQKEICNMLNKNMSYCDAIYKLLQMNVFLFNPKQYNFGNMDQSDISEICCKIGNAIVSDLVEDTIFNNCIGMKDDILDAFLNKPNKSNKNSDTNTKRDIEEVNTKLGGKNMDLPKGDATATIINHDNTIDLGDDSLEIYNENEDISSEDGDADDEYQDNEDENRYTAIDKLFQKTVCLLSLLTYSNDNNTIRSMYNSLDKTKRDTIRSLIFNHVNKSELKEEDIDKIIMRLIELGEQHNNTISAIKEIYKNADGKKRRELVAKHFVPTLEEYKNNAEIPTPVALVDKMLDLVPNEYWTKVNTTFEPCCGKGNFVLAIFHKFNNGLMTLYPNSYERMQVIISKCIYFTDLSNLNVAITTELLLAEAEIICGIQMEYKINSYCGDTLELDIKKVYGIDKFNAIIGNPPYNKGKNANFYVSFIKYAYENLVNDGLNLFVVPNRFMIPKHKANICLNMFQVNYIMHTVTDFDVSTDIGYYLATKSPQVNNENVCCVFANNIIHNISLNIPTPTSNNSFEIKKLSDKILSNTHAKIKLIKSRKEEIDEGSCLFIPRHWTRYASSKKQGGSHVFNISTKYGDDGRYIEVNENTKDNIIWYLTRSKVIRFITNNYASTVFIPPFIWESIPLIDFKIKYTDAQLYALFKLTEDEKILIEKIVD